MTENTKWEAAKAYLSRFTTTDILFTMPMFTILSLGFLSGITFVFGTEGAESRGELSRISLPQNYLASFFFIYLAFEKFLPKKLWIGSIFG